MKLSSLVLFVFVTFLFSSCASTKQYSKLEKKENVAQVYIIRDSSYGYFFASKVYVGNDLLGKLGKNSYLSFIPKSSEIELTSNMENTSKLSLQIEEGKTYYVRQKVKLGFFVKPRTKLELISEEEGKKALLEVKAPNLVVE